MREVNYYCDMCNEKFETPNRLIQIEIADEIGMGAFKVYGWEEAYLKQEICVKCKDHIIDFIERELQH